MAKTLEDKIIDNFFNASNSRFDEIMFARQMGEQDIHTQQAFFKAVMAYIVYKAAVADYNLVNRGSIAGVCQSIRNAVNRESLNVSSSLTPSSHY